MVHYTVKQKRENFFSSFCLVGVGLQSLKPSQMPLRVIWNSLKPSQFRLGSSEVARGPPKPSQGVGERIYYI